MREALFQVRELPRKPFPLRPRRQHTLPREQHLVRHLAERQPKREGGGREEGRAVEGTAERAGDVAVQGIVVGLMRRF